MQRLEPGFRLAAGRYELRRHLGSGGMGEVWAAQDLLLPRTVACKIMSLHLRDEIFVNRFREEAMHTAALHHVNIATLFDYGEDEGLAYIVMELVRGISLQTLLANEGQQTDERVRSVIGQAALALAVAHDAGIVHRDVKPGNIMVTTDGTVKLTDFGIAHSQESSGLTQQGEMLGTPYYVSPEQALGQTANPASDVYALGVVAHEMLTGRRPFEKPTPVATALAQVQDPPPPLPDDISADLREIIERCMSKEPGDRPRSAREVATALGAVETDPVWHTDEGSVIEAPDLDAVLVEQGDERLATPRRLFASGDPAHTPSDSEIGDSAFKFASARQRRLNEANAVNDAAETPASAHLRHDEAGSASATAMVKPVQRRVPIWWLAIAIAVAMGVTLMLEHLFFA